MTIAVRTAPVPLGHKANINLLGWKGLYGKLPIYPKMFSGRSPTRRGPPNNGKRVSQVQPGRKSPAVPCRNRSASCREEFGQYTLRSVCEHLERVRHVRASGEIFPDRSDSGE